MPTLITELIERWTPCGGRQSTNIGAILASATTIAPTHMVHKVSGTVEITTITVPWDGFKGFLFFIPTGAFTFATGGNIATAFTATANRPFFIYFDGALWYVQTVI